MPKAPSSNATAADASLPSPTLSGSLLFYGDPQPLSAGVHGALGVDPLHEPYAFMKGSQIVPLTVTEFVLASLSYPIVFIGDARQPVAVMGLRATENLFVDADGSFKSEAYVPAYARRYPFVLARDDAQDRMVLCIDRAASFVVEGGATPLFDEGRPTPFVNQALEFSTSFEQERVRTESFVKLLIELDLFDTRETVFTQRDQNGVAGAPQKLADYYGVSEEKLKALPADKLVELRDNGALVQIYAHLASLQGWDRLVALAYQRTVGINPLGNA